MRKLLVLILVLSMVSAVSAEIAFHDSNTLGNPGEQITINLLTAEGKQSVAIDLNDISQSSIVRIGYNAQEPIKSFTLKLTPDGGLVIDVSRDSNIAQIAGSAKVVSVPGSGDYVTLDVNCTVPNIVSQPEATATAAITAAGFTLGVRTTTSSDVPGIVAGDIISTNPAAGSYTCGISVDYVVSTGVGDCVIVPNVVNMPEATATVNITAAFLALGTRTTARHNTIVAGNIISTNPAYPNCVPSGTPVAYVVSLGPCIVPNCVGLTEPECCQALIAEGFICGSEVGVFSDTIPVHVVTAQSPAPGTAPCGAVINLSYVCRTVTCRNPRCVGDVDADTWVRASDITALVTLINTYPWPRYRAQNTTCQYNPCADIDFDNWVRSTDITALVTQIGTYPAPSYRCRCGGAACPYYP